jgi:transcription factor E2F3
MMSPGYANVANSPIPTPPSGKGSKMATKPKAVKGQKSCPQTPSFFGEQCTFNQPLIIFILDKVVHPTAYYFPGSPGNPATPVGGCRYDSSLG